MGLPGTMEPEAAPLYGQGEPLAPNSQFERSTGFPRLKRGIAERRLEGENADRRRENNRGRVRLNVANEVAFSFLKQMAGSAALEALWGKAARKPR